LAFSIIWHPRAIGQPPPGGWTFLEDCAIVARVSQPAIHVSALTKHFGDTRAVDGIDFDIQRGITAALLGGNGAGKTTTLSMLLGLLLPTAGRIRIFDEDMLRHRYRVLARMNFSSPYVDLPHRLTVRQNLTVYGRLYGLAHVAQRIETLAADLQIDEFLDRQTGKLSAGQKTRVALAKALLNEPELLLLDEPTASLDPDTGDWVRSYLEVYQRRSGATIPARLAQHGRSRAAVLGCDDDAPGTDRRPRQSARIDRALRPRHAGAGFPRHRPGRRALRSAGSGAVSIAAGERASALAHFSPGRVGAMLLRYLYLLRSSWPRTLELLYWPAIQMILWGFTSQFLMTNSSYVARAGGVLLAAVMLWDVMFRGQLGVSVSFLEELWSRNLGHLFVSPLRPYEWVLSLLAMSLVRVAIGVAPAALLAIPLYHYSIFTLGTPLIAFFVLLLVMGWGLGLVIGALLLRHGLGAESMAWLAVFLLAPASAVYYPVSVLPVWLQYVAWSLPSAHVFEGMRAVMFQGVFRLDHFFAALALDVVYTVFGAVVFLFAFRQARERGALLQTGE
jgi:ABC-2 type transport system permease protein